MLEDHSWLNCRKCRLHHSTLGSTLGSTALRGRRQQDQESEVIFRFEFKPSLSWMRTLGALQPPRLEEKQLQEPQEDVVTMLAFSVCCLSLLETHPANIWTLNLCSSSFTVGDLVTCCLYSGWLWLLSHPPRRKCHAASLLTATTKWKKTHYSYPNPIKIWPFLFKHRSTFFHFCSIKYA